MEFQEGTPNSACAGTWTFSGSASGGNAVRAEAPSGTLVRRQEVAQKATGPNSVFGATLRHLSGFGRQGLGGNLASVNLGPGGGSFAKRGLSACEWGYPIGVWGKLGYASSENDFVSVASDSTNVHGTLGGDVTVNDW